MDLEEKVDLNKKIRSYKGINSFIISLQKQLKTSKYLTRVEFNGKTVKLFSDKQYEICKTII
jgi:hypothetical protein